MGEAGSPPVSGGFSMPATAKSFRALLEKDDRALGWTIARVPFDPARAWKQMVRLRVRGDINGFAFRTSLFPDAHSGFYLLVNRAMQQGAAASLGETADFRLGPDLEPREAELPDELAVLLDHAPGLRDWYGDLTEYRSEERRALE